MKKDKAEEIVKMIGKAGVEADVIQKPGNRRIWSVTFIIEAVKKDQFEDILIDYRDLKLKLDYKPLGFMRERLYLY